MKIIFAEKDLNMKKTNQFLVLNVALKHHKQKILVCQVSNAYNTLNTNFLYLYLINLKLYF